MAADPRLEVRRAFARAVSANDRAMVITPDNDKDRWCRLDEAVGLDEAFAVEVRDDLVAVDADHSPTAAMAFVGFVHDLGLRPIVLRSGQPDRFHILVPCEDEKLRRTITDEAKRLGLDVRHGGSLIRPPLSMHRSRTCRSTLLEPLDEADALRLLVPPLPESLSPRLNVLLRYGDLFGDYNKNSAAEQAIIEALRGLGVSADRIEELLSDPSNVGGHHHQERTDKGWGGTDLDRSIRKADERIAERGLQLRGGPALEAIEELALAATARPWPGRNGSNDFKVYGAHLSHARQRRRTRYAASIRDIQLRAGLGSTTTVSRAQNRLVDAGLLRKWKHPKGTDAQEWSLMPCELDTLPLTREGGRELPCVSTTLGLEAHDLFRHRGLGPGPLHTYRTLLSANWPMTAGELVELTGKHRTTIKRHLEALEPHGLIQQIDEGWTALTPDLDLLASSLNVAGEGERHAAAVENERHGYRLFLEARKDLERLERERTGNRFGTPYLTGHRVRAHMRSQEEGRRLAM
jgi:predicted transcriptional regulator